MLSHDLALERLRDPQRQEEYQDAILEALERIARAVETLAGLRG